VTRPAAESRVDGLLQQAELRQPPEEVMAEELLRQRSLTGTDGELDVTARRQLRGDLVAGVTAADDEHSPPLDHHPPRSGQSAN
jgi:hypothetical protein